MKREIRFAIEVRAERGSPGRLRGTLMKYGERASTVRKSSVKARSNGTRTGL